MKITAHRAEPCVISAEKGASFEDMIGALVLVAVVFLAVGIK